MHGILINSYVFILYLIFFDIVIFLMKLRDEGKRKCIALISDDAVSVSNI